MLILAQSSYDNNHQVINDLVGVFPDLETIKDYVKKVWHETEPDFEKVTNPEYQMTENIELVFKSKPLVLDAVCFTVWKVKF